MGQNFWTGLYFTSTFTMINYGLVCLKRCFNAFKLELEISVANFWWIFVAGIFYGFWKEFTMCPISIYFSIIIFSIASHSSNAKSSQKDLKPLARISSKIDTFFQFHEKKTFIDFSFFLGFVERCVQIFHCTSSTNYEITTF